MNDKTTNERNMSGWNKADTDIDNYPQIDWDKTDEFEGTVHKIKSVELTRRGKLEPVRVAVVSDIEGEMFLLWETSNLEQFFNDLEPGAEIYLRQRGKQPLKGGRSMRIFDAYYR